MYIKYKQRRKYERRCNRWGCTHTHTHTDTSLKNEIMLVACNCFITGLIFGAQNLIRDG